MTNNYKNFNIMTYPRFKQTKSGLLILATLILLSLFTGQRTVQAGSYIFSGENNGINLITHPTGYMGIGGPLTVGVCIDSTSANAANMVLPLANMVNTFNTLQSVTPNLYINSTNNIGANEFDFESVALHEIGHCIGLAHVNAALESGLSGANRNYTKATDGFDNIFNIATGADGVIGNSDDVRGDDVNLHWYRNSTNNPCTIDNASVDSSTFSRDLSNLPIGHDFASNADRTVCANLGVPDTEAIMQQGAFNDEDQRQLSQDDVATLKLAMTGLDEISGNADDYTINLVSLGSVVNPASNPDCDLIMDFDNSQTGFAACQAGGTFVSATHVRVTSASIFFNNGFNWFFNTLSNDHGQCNGAPRVQGSTLALSNETITDGRRKRATSTITTGDNTNITSTGCLRLSAGTSITLGPGFSVSAGGEFGAVVEQ